MFIWINRGIAEPYIASPLHENIPKVNPTAATTPDKHSEVHPSNFKELTEHGFTPFKHSETYRKEESYKQFSKKIYYAKDIMSKNLITISPEESIEKAFKIFNQTKFRHLPVVNSNKTLFGIVSERDILKQKIRNLEIPESQITTIKNMQLKKTLTAFPLTPIRDIAKIMFDERIGCVPILHKEEYTIQGIVTRSDILKAIMNLPVLETYV